MLTSSASRIALFFLCLWSPGVFAHGGESLVIGGVVSVVALMLIILSLCTKTTWWQKLVLIIFPWVAVLLLSLTVAAVLRVIGVHWRIHDWTLFFSTVAFGPISVWLLCLWYFRAIPTSIQRLPQKFWSLFSPLFTWGRGVFWTIHDISQRVRQIDACDVQHYLSQVRTLSFKPILLCSLSIWLAWFFTYIISTQITHQLMSRLDMDAWASLCPQHGPYLFLSCFALPSWSIQLSLLSIVLYFWIQRFLKHYFAAPEVRPMQIPVLMFFAIALPLMLCALFYQLILFNALTAISIVIAIHRYFEKRPTADTKNA